MLIHVVLSDLKMVQTDKKITDYEMDKSGLFCSYLGKCHAVGQY